MSQTAENKTFVDVLASVQTGDKAQILTAIDEYRLFITNKMLSPWFIGPIAVIYAFRGKLTPFERGLLGVVGIAAMYNEFLKTKVSTPEEKWLHPLTQSNQATPSQALLLPSSDQVTDGQKSTI